jgi:DNA-binding NarL/FixJ family response regulator
VVTRVLLVEDDPLVRAGMRAVLEAEDPLGAEPAALVVAEAGDGSSAIRECVRHRPDVVLMDIRMPDMDGLTATAEIRRHLPGQAVVIVTTFDEDEYVDGALDLDVNGFLLKSGDPHDLRRAVTSTGHGAVHLAPTVAARLVRALQRHRTGDRADARARVAALTARERGVLALVARGLSNAEIAAALFLVEGTVKGYLSTIFAGLGVRNRVEAALVAVAAGDPT